MTKPELRWHAPVRLEDVPETGLHVDLVADAQARAGLCVLAEVRDLPRLDASVDVVRYRGGLRASGRMTATIGQTCVVTLEPMESTLDETFDVVFLPPEVAGGVAPGGEPAEAAEDAEAEPEMLVNGSADLGGFLTDLLLLGIDPYPRKPGAVFAAPVDENRADGPFAALAKLKLTGGGDNP